MVDLILTEDLVVGDTFEYHGTYYYTLAIREDEGGRTIGIAGGGGVYHPHGRKVRLVTPSKAVWYKGPKFSIEDSRAFDVVGLTDEAETYVGRDLVGRWNVSPWTWLKETKYNVIAKPSMIFLNYWEGFSHRLYMVGTGASHLRNQGVVCPDTTVTQIGVNRDTWENVLLIGTENPDTACILATLGAISF